MRVHVYTVIIQIYWRHDQKHNTVFLQWCFHCTRRVPVCCLTLDVDTIRSITVSLQFDRDVI